MDLHPELDQFVSTKREGNRKKLTSHLRPFTEYLDDEGVGIYEFDEVQVLEYLREGKYREYVKSDCELKPTYLNQIYRSIQNFLKWQRDRANNPQEHFERSQRLRRVRGVKPVRVVQTLNGRKWLTIDELERLFETAEIRGERDWTVFYLLGYFGCRAGELMDSAHRREIDFSGGELILLTEKADFERPLPFDQATGSMLAEALDRGWLDLSYQWLHKRANAYKFLFDDVNFTPHCLRHSFNHHMRKRLGDDTTVKLLMGHTVSSDMTSYYDRGRTRKQLRKAMLENHYYNELQFYSPT